MSFIQQIATGIYCMGAKVVSSVKAVMEKGRGRPGGPVVKTLPSSVGDAGSIPGQGAKVPRVLQPKTKP